MNTNDKRACSRLGHCDPSAVYSVTTYYGDCCHEDASSYVLSHSRKFLDIIQRIKDQRKIWQQWAMHSTN